MRILALDIGTGTQDILLFDSQQAVENCVKMVMPSPTQIIARRVEEATRRGEAVLLTGVTMGGGPCAWAVDAHLKAGCPVFATPEAARTFDDHLENVAHMGITVVSEDEARGLKEAEQISMRDLDLEMVNKALEAFGVAPQYDGVAVAVFDHGAAPIDVSDRIFRFGHLRQAVEKENALHAFGYLAAEVPPYLTRMKAVAGSFPLDVPLLLMDTASAGALGALDDPQVRRQKERLLVNLGNMHTTAFHLRGEAIVSLMEHHTGLVSRDKLEGLLEKLVVGTLTNDEVFRDQGHGAHIFETAPSPPREQPFLAVTGPKRSMLAGSSLKPYFAAPHGDMMLSGCFGLVRCFAHKMPQWQEEISDALESPPEAERNHSH